MRKLLIGMVAVGLVLAGGVFALVMPRQCPVNRAAFERIEVGMTQSEVEQILGGPPGDYRTRPDDTWRVMVWDEWWLGDEGDVSVGFTPGGAVERAEFSEKPPYHPGQVALVRWRLKRLKERWLP